MHLESEGLYPAQKLVTLERELKAVQQWTRDTNSLKRHYEEAKSRAKLLEKQHEDRLKMLSEHREWLRRARLGLEKKLEEKTEELHKLKEELSEKTESLRWTENRLFPCGPPTMPSRF